MKAKRAVITLITDFGGQGEYSGAMKGVILRLNPACQIIDITHEISPQNILQAAWVLKNCYAYYPPGTVHLVVVDPGVGTARRAVAVKKGEYSFVGPDDGVFTWIYRQGKASVHELTDSRYHLSPVSDTFHGRDIFAPAAAHLSLGVKPASFGPAVEDPVSLEWPRPTLSRGTLRGRILWADSFGNGMTNISREEFGPGLEGRGVEISGKGWRIKRISRTYGEGKPGETMALFGSGGLLEISINSGSARAALGLKAGDPIVLKLK